MNLNEFSKQIHADNKAKGFYDDENETLHQMALSQIKPMLSNAVMRSFQMQRLMLITSEISEAVEALRKENFGAISFNPNVDEMDNAEFKNYFELNHKNTYSDEIADTIIRLLDLCGRENIDIDSCIKYKLQYNQLRPYKHGKTF